MAEKNARAGAEHRRHHRLEVALPLRVRGRDACGAAFEDSTSSYNVSREGASFVTRRELLVGQSLEFIIPHRPQPHEVSPRPDFETTGVVRRLISRTEGEWEVGVEFTGPRLRTYIPETA